MDRHLVTVFGGSGFIGSPPRTTIGGGGRHRSRRGTRSRGGAVSQDNGGSRTDRPLRRRHHGCRAYPGGGRRCGSGGQPGRHSRATGTVWIAHLPAGSRRRRCKRGRGDQGRRRRPPRPRLGPRCRCAVFCRIRANQGGRRGCGARRLSGGHHPAPQRGVRARGQVLQHVRNDRPAVARAPGVRLPDHPQGDLLRRRRTGQDRRLRRRRHPVSAGLRGRRGRGDLQGHLRARNPRPYLRVGRAAGVQLQGTHGTGARRDRTPAAFSAGPPSKSPPFRPGSWKSGRGPCSPGTRCGC